MTIVVIRAEVIVKTAERKLINIDIIIFQIDHLKVEAKIEDNTIEAEAEVITEINEETEVEVEVEASETETKAKALVEVDLKNIIPAPKKRE